MQLQTSSQNLIIYHPNAHQLDLHSAPVFKLESVLSWLQLFEKLEK